MLRFHLLPLALLVSLALAGCGDKPAASDARSPATTESPATAATPPAGVPKASGAMHGPVLETMNAGSYTYVQVRTAAGDVWAAAPTTVVAVGDEVTLPQGMLMQNFKSPSLDREFKEIYFVNVIQKAGDAGQAPAPGSAKMPGSEPGAEHTGAVMDGKAVTGGSIARAEGGRTIAEIHAARLELGGQRVKVRGQVVKATMGVMGRNWLHIQDGSAAGAQGDLTVTTAGGGVKVGDVVLIEGTAAADRDFGAGYRYEVLVEDATVTVEPR